MSVLLNGSNTWLENTTDSFGVTAYPITMFAWARKSSSSNPTLLTLANTGTHTLRANTTAPYKSQAVVVQSATVFSGKPATDGAIDTWIPYCWTFDTNEITVYQSTYSNSSTSTTAQSYQTNSSPKISAGSLLRGSVLNGYLAEVATWSTKLVQADIESLLGGDAPDSVATGSITRYWAFDTDDANLFIDSEGSITLTDINANTVFSSIHPTITTGGAVTPLFTNHINKLNNG